MGTTRNIILPVIGALDGLVRTRRTRRRAEIGGTAARHGGRGRLECAVLDRLEVGDHVGAIGIVLDWDDHGRTRHDGRRRAQKSVQGGGIPGQSRGLHGGRVAEVGARGVAAEDPIQIGALAPAVVARFGAVAQRALGMENGLAGGGVGTKHWCSAHQSGKQACRSNRSHVVPPGGQ